MLNQILTLCHDDIGRRCEQFAILAAWTSLLAFTVRVLTFVQLVVWFTSELSGALFEIFILLAILEGAVLVGRLVFFMVLWHLTNRMCLPFVSSIEAHCLIWVYRFLTTEHQLSADRIVQAHLRTMSKLSLRRFVILTTLDEWLSQWIFMIWVLRVSSTSFTVSWARSPGVAAEYYCN